MKRDKPFLAFLWPSIYRDSAVDVPQGGIALWWYVISENVFKLTLLNMLSLVLCLPLFTVPATMTAVSRVLMKLCYTGCTDIFREFFREWKRSLLRYLPFFLISGSLGFFAALLLISELTAGGITVPGVLAFLALLFVGLLWCYAFPIFAYVELPVMASIKNACIFTLTQWKTDLKLLLPLLMWTLTALYFPSTLTVALLFLVPMPALLAVVAVKPTVDRYILHTDPEKGE